jgi:PKD domain-containing protein
MRAGGGGVRLSFERAGQRYSTKMENRTRAVCLLLGILVLPATARGGTVTGVTVSPASVPTGTPASVTVTGTNPCGAAHIIYGDGTAITYPITGLPTTQTHAYDNPGTYAITAKGMGNCDGEATTTVTVTGQPKPQPPPSPPAQITAVDFSPRPVRVREPVTIAVNGTGTCAFEIAFGDGRAEQFNVRLPHLVQHTYAAAQTFTVLVRPNPPCAGRFTEQLQVVDGAPQAAARIGRILVTPTPADAGQQVSIAVEGTGKCAYTIDYGDGNAETRARDLPDRVQHVYRAPGTYNVSAVAERPCTGLARANVEVRSTSRATVTGVEAVPNPVTQGVQTMILIKGVGTCDFTVDFGDETSRSYSGPLPRRVPHTYNVSGRYTIEVLSEPPCSAGMRTTLDVVRRRSP